MKIIAVTSAGHYSATYLCEVTHEELRKLSGEDALPAPAHASPQTNIGKTVNVSKLYEWLTELLRAGRKVSEAQAGLRAAAAALDAPLGIVDEIGLPTTDKKQ